MCGRGVGGGLALRFDNIVCHRRHGGGARFGQFDEVLVCRYFQTSFGFFLYDMEGDSGSEVGKFDGTEALELVGLAVGQEKTEYHYTL